MRRASRLWRSPSGEQGEFGPSGRPFWWPHCPPPPEHCSGGQACPRQQAMGRAGGGWGQVLGTWREAQWGESCLGEGCHRRTEWTHWASLTVFLLATPWDGRSHWQVVQTSQGPPRPGSLSVPCRPELCTPSGGSFGHRRHCLVPTSPDRHVEMDKVSGGRLSDRWGISLLRGGYLSGGEGALPPLMNQILPS